MPPTLEGIGNNRSITRALLISRALAARGLADYQNTHLNASESPSAVRNSEQQRPVTPPPPSYDEVMHPESVPPPSYSSLRLQPPPTCEVNVASNGSRPFNSRLPDVAYFVGNNVILNMGDEEVEGRNLSSIVWGAIFLLFLGGLEIYFAFFYKNNTVMCVNAVLIVVVAMKIIVLSIDRDMLRAIMCMLPCRR